VPLCGGVVGYMYSAMGSVGLCVSVNVKKICRRRIFGCV
jgi:hypothetical protein